MADCATPALRRVFLVTLRLHELVHGAARTKPTCLRFDCSMTVSLFMHSTTAHRLSQIHTQYEGCHHQGQPVMSHSVLRTVPWGNMFSGVPMGVAVKESAGSTDRTEFHFRCLAVMVPLPPPPPNLRASQDLPYLTHKVILKGLSHPLKPHPSHCFHYCNKSCYHPPNLTAFPSKYALRSVTKNSPPVYSWLSEKSWSQSDWHIETSPLLDSCNKSYKSGSR